MAIISQVSCKIENKNINNALYSAKFTIQQQKTLYLQPLRLIPEAFRLETIA